MQSFFICMIIPLIMLVVLAVSIYAVDCVLKYLLEGRK